MLAMVLVRAREMHGTGLPVPRSFSLLRVLNKIGGMRANLGFMS